MRVGLAVILTAVGGDAVGAQTATSEIYGDFRYSYNRADAGDTTHWASANNASRLGVRGEVSAGTLSAFVDLQTGVNIDAGEPGGALTQRYYLAGIRSRFGTVTVGRHSTAYKLAGLRLDPFYDASTVHTGGGVPTTGLFAGASFGLSSLTNGFADRAVAYTSPTLAGVTVNAAAYVDTDANHDYGIGVGYRGNGLNAGAQYYNANGSGPWAQTAGIDHALRSYLGYTRAGAWSLGASYERLEPNAGNPQDYFFAAGTTNVTSRLLVAGAIGHVGAGSVQPAVGTAYHVGVFYALFTEVRLHALYSRLDTRDMPSRSNAALGFTYQFSIKR